MTKAETRPLRIGTRASQLALWQAEHVAGLIGSLEGAPSVELVTIKTTGDLIADAPLSKVAGKGFFTKEIERALLGEEVDVAVHSLKDLETRLPQGLTLPAVLEREDPRDVLIGPPHATLDTLPSGAVVGTSSLRRKAFLSHLRPDLEIRDLRGNVPTRIRKLRGGEYDALILAAAGVKRLGMDEHIAEFLPPDRIFPAVAQGAVAVQTREDDQRTASWITPLDHRETRLATAAERALLRSLEGGCQVPVGGLATVRNGEIRLLAAVCSLDGKEVVEGAKSGPASDCELIGRTLAQDLLSRGGASILQSIRQQ